VSDLVKAPPTTLAAQIERAQRTGRRARPPNTARALTGDWLRFTAWCEAQGATPLPCAPEVLAAYLHSLAEAGKKVATIERALSTISQAHTEADTPWNPRASKVVKDLMKALRRQLGVAPTQKTPLVLADLVRALEACPQTTAGLRDRALLAVGFAGAFRRSELVALDVADLRWEPKGVVITIRRSKTDQVGAGRLVALPVQSATQAVQALRAWLVAGQIEEGPVFRGVGKAGHVYAKRMTSGTVAALVKKVVQRVGLDPKLFAGHSLRAGLATSAAQGNKRREKIRAQTGHKSDKMLDRYIREADLFRDNAAELKLEDE
jgi:integrase